MGLLVVHAAATWFMTGLIWFVQIVHYPLFAMVGDAAFIPYEAAHQRRTTWVVAPLMLLEAGSSVLLLTPLSGSPRTPLAWLGLAMLVLIWLSTFLVQVPLHATLERAGSKASMRRLVTTNWIRTFAWTSRAVIAGWMIVDWHR